MSGRGKYSGSKRVRAARAECGVEGCLLVPQVQGEDPVLE